MSYIDALYKKDEDKVYVVERNAKGERIFVEFTIILKSYSNAFYGGLLEPVNKSIVLIAFSEAKKWI